MKRGKKYIACFFLILFVSLGIYYFFPVKKFPANKVVTRIILLKSKKQLQVYAGNELLKTYVVSLGFHPGGKKHFEGDGKTPEGIYAINDKNPNSKCYLNLGVSYPDKNDIAYAKQQHKSTGGNIKIHGINPRYAWIGKFHRFINWSSGCICVTNKEIKELYDHVPVGIPIEIRP